MLGSLKQAGVTSTFHLSPGHLVQNELNPGRERVLAQRQDHKGSEWPSINMEERGNGVEREREGMEKERE